MAFRSFSVQGATIRGVEAIPVSVEVVISNGLPGFAIVGMADAAIQESRERVKAALRSSGFVMPNEKIVVNLAPGALRKTGSGFDLPIALGILAATGQMDAEVVRHALVVGELFSGRRRALLDGHVGVSALCGRAWARTDSWGSR